MNHHHERMLDKAEQILDDNRYIVNGKEHRRISREIKHLENEIKHIESAIRKWKFELNNIPNRVKHNNKQILDIMNGLKSQIKDDESLEANTCRERIKRITNDNKLLNTINNLS